MGVGFLYRRLELGNRACPISSVMDDSSCVVGARVRTGDIVVY